MADKDYVPPMPDAVSLDVETCPKVCAGKAFIPPHRTDKTESDMEDIVIVRLSPHFSKQITPLNKL